jgi:transposase-like protein
MSGRKGMKKYPTETKLEAVRLFYEEGKTHAEIANLLGLGQKERVEVWVRQYRREGVVGLSKVQGRPRKQAESQQAELDRLRMENALLKKFQAELRKDVLAKRNIGSSTTTEPSTK